MLLTACTSSQLNIDREKLPLPDTWQSIKQQQAHTQMAALSEAVLNPELRRHLSLAIEQNRSLQQTELSVAIAEKTVEATGTNVWPSLDLNLSANRSKSVNDSSSVYSTSTGLNLELKYELDVWGKLSAEEKQANYRLNATRYSYQQAKNQLIVDVITRYYAVIEAQMQLDLFSRRAKNTSENLSIIESGYEQGLSSALDVYLTRNDLATEQGRVAQQQQQLRNATRALELLIGQYPASTLQHSTVELPAMNSLWLPGNTSTVAASNPALQGQWAELLAADAQLAVAHKQRFPSFQLTARTGTSSDALSDLLSTSQLTWSLLGNITTPLFNAGRLKANEKKAELELRQAEVGYLDALFSTFSQIEQSLDSYNALNTQLKSNIDAMENATAAEQLSFEQYQSGLVNYATVLTAQTRAFNAQSAVIQLQYQLIENQMNLLLLLGGDLTNLIEQKTM